MKFNAVTTAAVSAALLASAHAEEVADEASPAVPELSTFTVSLMTRFPSSSSRLSADDPAETTFNWKLTTCPTAYHPQGRLP